MATEYLKCTLTEKEIKESGFNLALSSSKINDLEAQKKSFNDQIKADISAAEAEIQRLALMIQNGYEYRMVEVEEEIDPLERCVMIIRTDTGEMVRVRPLKPEEMQGDLFQIKAE